MTTPTLDRFAALTDADGPVSLDAVLELFDTLPAVATEELLGDWEGTVIEVGHPGEAQLGALNWAGKTFRGANDVDPIVVHGPDGREASDVMGSATLRMVEFRGVSTATMVYDRHPIFDHFRRVSDDVVLGIMDRKGADPMAFYLRPLA